MATLHVLTAPGRWRKRIGAWQHTATNGGRPAKQSDGLSGGQLLPVRPCGGPQRFRMVASYLVQGLVGLVSTQLPVQGINESVDPRRRFILEPGSCSRRCSTTAIIPAAAGGACAGTRTWSGQDRRREGRPGARLGGQLSSWMPRSGEERDAGPARLPDLTESGSGRSLESRVSRFEDAKRSERAGRSSRFRGLWTAATLPQGRLVPRQAKQAQTT